MISFVRATKRLFASTLLAGLAVGTGLAGGTASAGTVLPDGCGGLVSGNTGDQVAITGESVKELVRRGADSAGTLAMHWIAADDIAKKGTIWLATVPDAPSGSVAGDAIGGAVANALRGSWGLGVDPARTLTNIRNTVASGCGGLTVRVANFKLPPQAQPQPQPPAQGSGQGSAAGTGGAAGVPVTGGGTGTATAPPRDYGAVAAAMPGGTAPPPGVRYPDASPIPGAKPPGVSTLGAPDPTVRAAGKADALAATAGQGNVQLPMLLAVVALAGVTSALVRTWVLRRPS